MIRYYDQKTTQCDDCFFYQPGEYTDGRPYMACRQYGYIISDKKPVTDEKCEKFVSHDAHEREEQMRQRVRSMRELARQKRRK